MLVVNYRRSYRALNQYIGYYNAERDKIADKIKASVVLTAREIIRIYGAFLTKLNGIEKIDPNDLKGLYMTNSQLARETHSSNRTIQRHIKRLMKAGIISKKVFHGTNAGYELWINKDILILNKWLSVEEATAQLVDTLKQDLARERETEVLNKGMTNCRYTNTGYNRYSNNLLIDVDNLEDGTPEKQAGITDNDNENRCSLPLTESKKTGNTTGNTLTGYTGDQDAGNFPDSDKKRENIAKNSNIPAEKCSNKKVNRTTSEKAGDQMRERAGKSKNEETKMVEDDPARRESLEFYVNLLWTLVRNTLYSGVLLTDWQIENARKLLFNWYEPVKTSKLKEAYENYTVRVNLVKKFVEKDPKHRYVQLPHKYFDTNNPNGFRGTKKWLRLHRIRQKEIHDQRIVQNCIRRYINSLKNESIKPESPAKVFRDCEIKIGKLNNPDLLEQFYAAVLKPQVFDEIQYKKSLSLC